jgi:hypothetical protein
MGRRFGAFAVMVLGVPLVMLAGATDALACSCASAPFAAQVERSDIVFTGRAVDGTHAPDHGPVSSLDPVTWTFHVDRVHKGDAEELQPVTSARSEASCGFEFEPGTAYVVLADAQPDGTLATGLCQGTQPVEGLTALGTAPRAVGPVAETPIGPTITSVATPWLQVGVGGGVAVLVLGLAARAVLRRR